LVNQKSLAIFAKSRYKKKGIMDGTGTQRLSQKDKSVQAVAGTTNCKGVQISRIAEWANKHGYWIETAELGSYEDRSL
jgi:hypothetical protein